MSDVNLDSIDADDVCDLLYDELSGGLNAQYIATLYDVICFRLFVIDTWDS